MTDDVLRRFDAFAAAGRVGMTGALARQVLAAGEALGLLYFDGGTWRPVTGRRAA